MKDASFLAQVRGGAAVSVTGPAPHWLQNSAFIQADGGAVNTLARLEVSWPTKNPQADSAHLAGCCPDEAGLDALRRGVFGGPLRWE